MSFRSSVISKGGSDTIEEDHVEINTEDDEKNVRLNSRSYTGTSGSHCAVQSKPSETVTGTQDCIAFEASPRFQDAIGGRDLIGFKSNPDLKGTTGDLTGAIRAYEGKLESASGNTRTIAVAAVLHCMQALHGTVTLGPYPIIVDAGGGNVAWAGFAYLADDDQVASKDDTTLGDGSVAGYVKFNIGGTVLYARLYAA